MPSSDFFRIQLERDDLVAAPLAGITHMPFRKALRRYFNGIIYSEMISVEGLARRNKETLEYLDRTPGESPLVFQLFGGRPSSFSEAVKTVLDSVYADALDINMGCPVKKVIKAGGGCSLLSDLPRLKNIVAAVRKASDVPFSIKIRVGLESSKPVYDEILKIAEGEGADALIIHARTKSDMFGGTVRLDVLEEVSSRAAIPVIGNGGVNSPETYQEMKKTGVAGVMIGRGMMKAPWIFETIRKGVSSDGYLAGCEISDLLSSVWEDMKTHADCRNNKRIHYLQILRKFSVWYSKGFEDAASFRTGVYKLSAEEDILKYIESFFSSASYVIRA